MSSNNTVSPERQRPERESCDEELDPLAITPSDERLPYLYPHFRGKPLYDGNREALAWALDGIGRAIQFVGAGAFFGTALIRIAKEAAGCATEAPEGETEIPECNEKVYGIKPSSLLTTYTMIVGVASACVLPLMGALIDYTPYRLRVGRTVSFLFTVLIFPTIFLNEENFFAVAIVQVVLSFTSWIQTSLSYAYLPELTTDELLLNQYCKSFTINMFVAMILYMAVVIGSLQAAGYGDDDVKATQVAMLIAFCVNVVCLGSAWGVLFRPRSRMHELPSHQSLWTAGFIQLYRTARNIGTNYRALKWFYISVAMSDAASQSLATIVITYTVDQMQFTAQQNGIVIGCMVLGNVPGAMMSSIATRLMDPVKSSMAALAVLIMITGLFALFLKNPNQHLLTYLFVFIGGIGTGWKWTSDRLIASLIIPDGQDAELMGFFLFSGQCLSWMPPLIYTAINEAGISQRVGVATLDLFFLSGMTCLLLIGGYAKARTEAGRSISATDTVTTSMASKAAGESSCIKETVADDHLLEADEIEGESGAAEAVIEKEIKG